MINDKQLMKNGFRQVRSELHAYQLIRWWLKHLAKNQQRQLPERCLFDLLAIKPGVWFKIFRSNNSHHKALLFWHGPVAKSTTIESKEVDGQ
jgi:hypothetical protein